MKILQVSDAYLPFPGGVGEHIYNLKKYLQRLGHSVYVLTTGYPGMQEEIDSNVIRRGEVFLTPPLKIFNNTQLTLTLDLKICSFLKDFYRKNSFDIVHLHGPLAPNLPGLALHYAPYPCVATFHTAFIGTNWNKLAKIIYNKDALKLKTFIFVSKTAKDAVIPPYRGKWIIIPNGVDLEVFYPAPSGRHVEGRVNIGFLSRHEPRKGLDVLLQAFSENEVLKKNASLIIGSSGPLTDYYKKFCKEKDIPAIFMGRIPREKLPEFYRKLDVFVAPSTGGESFGLILLEAMACGIPVLASDIEGYRNVITDGFNGLLFKNRDSKDLSEKLMELIADEKLYQRLRASGLMYVEGFHWLEIARRVEDVYKGVLELC